MRETRTPFSSPQFFRALPDAYLFVSPQSVIVDATDAFLTLMGGLRHQLLGAPLGNAYLQATPSFSQTMRNSFERTLQTKSVDAGQIEERTRVWQISTTPIFNAHGEVELVLQRVEDTTTQRWESIRSISDALPQLVWRTNPDGLADYCNKRLADYVGFSEEDLMGEGWVELIHPDDRARALADWAHARERQTSAAIDFRIRAADGSYRWFLSLGLPYRDHTGEVTKYYGTWTDIEETRAAQEAAELANQSKSAFLANMSHEIRTPLGVVRGFAELLEDEVDLTAEQREWVCTIRRNTHHVTALIDDLLDLSKIESNRLEVERIRFPLLTAVQDVLSILHFKAEEKGVALNLSTLGDLPQRILSDPLRFKQILLNLVGNAIKFTDGGHVDVELSVADHKLHCLIRDTGMGICQSHRERLFQPFSQADSSMTRKFGGTGLGLYISQRLARALGGDLVLRESVPRAGSCFHLMIDCGPLETEVTALSTPAPESLSKIQSQLEGHPHILIVDDSLDNQNLLRRILTRAGGAVEVANNGIEAVEKALGGEFDVVLMDIQMPLLDGYGATRKLREANYQRPIIALTAHAMKEEREQCLRSGFNDHLSKPVDRQALFDAIDQCQQH